MENFNNNDTYNNLLKKLSELTNKEASLNEIQDFLYELDSIMISISVNIFDEKFLLPFYSLLNRRKGSSTIGEFFLNKYLINKEKITPSLIMYFYLKQKDELGFKETYNRFEIGTHDIAYTEHYEAKYMYLNYLSYYKKYNDAEEFNYQCMEDVIHEITHIYQFSISPDTKDIYEMLIYNDIQLWELSKKSKILNYEGLHDTYAIEHHANIFSRHYMINYANKHPELFNSNFIKRKQEKFEKKVNGNFESRYCGIRNFFRYLLFDKEYGYFTKYHPEEIKKQDSLPDYYKEQLITNEKFEDVKRQFMELLEKENRIIDYIYYNMPDNIKKVHLGITRVYPEMLIDDEFMAKKGISK